MCVTIGHLYLFVLPPRGIKPVTSVSAGHLPPTLEVLKVIKSDFTRHHCTVMTAMSKLYCLNSLKSNIGSYLLTAYNLFVYLIKTSNRLVPYSRNKTSTVLITCLGIDKTLQHPPVSRQSSIHWYLWRLVALVMSQ